MELICGLAGHFRQSSANFLHLQAENSEETRLPAVMFE